MYHKGPKNKIEFFHLKRTFWGLGWLFIFGHSVTEFRLQEIVWSRLNLNIRTFFVMVVEFVVRNLCWVENNFKFLLYLNHKICWFINHYWHILFYMHPEKQSCAIKQTRRKNKTVLEVIPENPPILYVREVFGIPKNFLILFFL